MKIDSFLARCYQVLDIPKSIENGLVKLYGVDALSDVNQTDKVKIYNCHEYFFREGKITDYKNCCKEYALYYLPVNFYKVWRPLSDLLEKSQIKENCNILELGSGPGSTTFGILEFYKHLALDNASLKFKINLIIVEIEIEFIKIFNELYENYKKDLPENLDVSIEIYNDNVSSFLISNKKTYDYIIESNLLNPNEKIFKSALNDTFNKLTETLNPNSSIILIEPAKKELNKVIRILKSVMHNNGMNIYSPCSCDTICDQLTLANIDISSIKILNDLYSYNIINPSKQKKFHYYEYVIFRNDGLSKFRLNKCFSKKFVKLSELEQHIGELITFEAYITHFIDKDHKYSIKICDGSLCSYKDIWISIQKNTFPDQMTISNMGRGGIISVKDAIVKSPKQIECTMSTRVRLWR